MGQYNYYGGSIINPPIDTSKIAKPINFSPEILKQTGFCFPVVISTASADNQVPGARAPNMISLMAHFDTGTNDTIIDVSIPRKLGLSSIGKKYRDTGGGRIESANYVIDLSFPNTTLMPFHNLSVGTCALPFKLEENELNPDNCKNFGMLIGRDIMSRWTIIWNGPTSTIIISD